MEYILVLVAGALLGAAVFALFGGARRPASPSLRDRRALNDPPPPAESPEAILDHLSEGVIVLNDLLRPITVNDAADRMLHLRGTATVLLPDELMSLARRALTSAKKVEEVVDVWAPDRVSVLVTSVPLPLDGGVLLVIKDVSTEQRALRVRRQFVSHASHELKSPVAGIQALAEAITKSAADDPETTEEFAQKLLKETSRVAKLVADLLDLSRIEDPGSFSSHPVEISEVVRREAEEVRGRAESKGLTFTVTVEPDVWTQGEDQQVGLLIRNLLDNAVRYTPEGGTVSVVTEREGESAIVRVSDDGIGIPLKAQARVFERFYRVDEARSRDQGGTGLGLAIVKHVADLYGGRVELRSEFGEGSTFTAFLPAMDPQRESEPSV